MTAAAWVVMMAGVLLQQAQQPAEQQVFAAEQRTFERLLAQARDGTLAQYRQAVEQFRRRGQPAAAWLHAKVLADPEGQDGWLASILLARLQHGDALSALEGELGAKIVAARKNWPSGSIKGRISGAAGPLLLADERHLLDQMEVYRPIRGRMFPLSGIIFVPPSGPAPSDRNAFRTYWNSLRVSKSEHWGPLCGEILLKGWDGALPQVQSPRNDFGIITEDHFVAEAANLLGKLGERRALPRLRAMIGDEECVLIVKASAMRALARLEGAQGIREVLEMAKNEKLDEDVRRAAIHAVVSFAGADELPMLEEIAALGRGQVPSQATFAIRRIQERAAAAEAAKEEEAAKEQ